MSEPQQEETKLTDTETMVHKIKEAIFDTCTSGQFITITELTKGWSDRPVNPESRKITKGLIGAALRATREDQDESRADRIFVPIKKIPSLAELKEIERYEDAHKYMAGYGQRSKTKAVYEGKQDRREHDYFVEAYLMRRLKILPAINNQFALLLEAGHRKILTSGQMSRLAFFFEETWVLMQKASVPILQMPGFDKLTAEDFLGLAIKKEQETNGKLLTDGSEEE